MHELALWALPLLGGPLFAARRWLAGRRVKPAGGPRLGEVVAVRGRYPSATSGYGGHIDVGKHDGQATVFAFLSNRCPGVKAYDGRLRDLVRHYGPRGVRFVGVNSVPESLYPNEGLPGMRRAAAERGITMPYVKDAGQVLMRQLGAACTPQAFVLDGEGRLRYRGRIDDAFVAAKARQHDLRDALDDLLAGRPVANPETPPLGCAIDVAPASPLSTVPSTRSVPA